MDIDMDTAIDIDSYGEKSYLVVVVPSYRNLAMTQTDINMNPALDLPRTAVSRGAASRTNILTPSFDHSSQASPILSRQPSIRTFPSSPYIKSHVC